MCPLQTARQEDSLGGAPIKIVMLYARAPCAEGTCVGRMQGLTLAKNLETNNSAVKCYGLVLSLRGVTWVARRAWVLAMPGQIRPAVGAKAGQQNPVEPGRRIRVQTSLCNIRRAIWPIR